MKKIIFGGILFIGGMIGVLASFLVAAINPGIYNNFHGLLGSLLVTGSIFPFLFFFTIALLGVIICIHEIYFIGRNMPKN